MKKSMIVGLTGAAALAMSVSALAAAPGWDVGAKLGMDKYHKTNSATIADVGTLDVKDTSGIGGGIYGDYNFNENFGLRAGLNKYSNLKLSSGGENLATIKYMSLDLLAMGYLPVADNVDLLGGLGLAYVSEKGDADGDGSSSTDHFTRPELLVGASWNIDSNWGLELTYSRIFGKGSLQSAVDNGDSKDWLPSIDLLALGVTYSF